ncbi:MAG TPA: HEAT repeat domain-containing protein [Candidatus Eisenbacteria bacterium]|nr:HEAT repeat domain-containing protein [Candidatus Eisenbacteria bacterium]
MSTFSPPKSCFRRRMPAAFIGTFLWLATVPTPAQTPFEQAWNILRAGAPDKSSEQCLATLRVRQLIPGDAKAVALVEKKLQDDDPCVCGAAALSLGAMKFKSAIPQLTAAAKTDQDGAVVLAAAAAVVRLSSLAKRTAR